MEDGIAKFAEEALAGRKLDGAAAQELRGEFLPAALKFGIGLRVRAHESGDDFLHPGARRLACREFGDEGLGISPFFKAFRNLRPLPRRQEAG